MTLEDQYIRMYQTLKATEDELSILPGGWIEQRVKDDQTYEYYRYWENGKKCTGDPAQLEEMKAAIKRRNYLRIQCRKLKCEMKDFRNTLKAAGLRPVSIIRRFNAEQNRLRQQALKNQQEQLVASRKKYAKNYKFRTDRGELVASKSEMMIANTLFRLKIPYFYEQEILLYPNTPYRPDFTIFYNGQIYYWEHLGIMDDQDYRNRWYIKRELYESNGIIPDVNLILTTETQDMPLTQEQIDLVLQTHLKVKLY